MTSTVALGVGLATLTDAGKVLDCWFPHLATGDEAEAVAERLGAPDATTVALTDDAARAVAGSAPALAPIIDGVLAGRADDGPLRTRRIAVATRIDDVADAPRDAHDVYLRLHLLSARHHRPHDVDLDGAFGLLNNVVWTDHGPADPASLPQVRLALAARGRGLRVTSVDKFPRMTDYVVPSGVRIADADRVRLGAHLAEGTTVMHEGFVNFNAGTLGASMIEGRISAGVVVGDGSDIGGGASIMGTLSGGGTEVIRIGERCLIGANAGVGISLGDGSVVEAGLYVTAGTKVTTEDGDVVKARTLSGASDLLFRRDSRTGTVVALRRRTTGDWGGLNTALHAND